MSEQITKKEYQIIKKFIRNKTQNLEFFKCYANEDWYDSHELSSVIVSKKMQSGKICFVAYLIDKGCLGLKSTYFRMNMTEYEYDNFIDYLIESEERDFVEITAEDAHNIIFGGVDYAESCGFQPLDKDWAVSKHFLNEELITDGIDEIEFGKDGKPFYLPGPYDNVKKHLAILDKKFGEGNYDYLPLGRGF